MENGKSVADVRAWGMWLAMKVDSSSGSLTLCKDGECSQEFCIWDSQCIEGYHCCKTNFEFTCQKKYRPEQVEMWCLLSTLKGSSDFESSPLCANFWSFSWPASHCRLSYRILLWQLHQSKVHWYFFTRIVDYCQNTMTTNSWFNPIPSLMQNRELHLFPFVGDFSLSERVFPISTFDCKKGNPYHCCFN